jgi:hypothetical protein
MIYIYIHVSDSLYIEMVYIFSSILAVIVAVIITTDGRWRLEWSNLSQITGVVEKYMDIPRTGGRRYDLLIFLNCPAGIFATPYE